MLLNELEPPEPLDYFPKKAFVIFIIKMMLVIVFAVVVGFCARIILNNITGFGGIFIVILFMPAMIPPIILATIIAIVNAFKSAAYYSVESISERDSKQLFSTSVVVFLIQLLVSAALILFMLEERISFWFATALIAPVAYFVLIIIYTGRSKPSKPKKDIGIE